jgi:hypothetical protein
MYFDLMQIALYLLAVWVTLIIQVYRNRENIPIMLLWLSVWPLGMYSYLLLSRNAILVACFFVWAFAMASLPSFGQHRPVRQVPQ